MSCLDIGNTLLARRQVVVDGNAGIVHQHVEARPLRADGVGGGRYAFLVCDVDLKPMNVKAFGAQCLRRRHETPIWIVNQA